ncbi:MAG: LysR family transcriptional regulator [Oscillospiraceae bacterium]|jgi:DNA-binding transcriptional LysR family regulator
MELQTLRLFRVIALEGSFSKAAQKLNYAQSNLSMKMAQLEKELEATLFYRHNRGVSLTPKGEILLQYATDLLNLANETEAALREDGETKGVLAIGSMESTAISLLPGLLSTYHWDNPHVTLTVQTGPTEQSIRGVLDYTLDGAFVAGPVRHPDLVAKPVRQEYLVLMTDCTYPEIMTSKELLGQTLLVFPQGCSYRRILEQWLHSEALFPQKIIEFNSLGAIIASVSAGLGISLFPESVVQTYADNGVLRCHAIPEQYALVQTEFIYRKAGVTEPALKRFLITLDRK